MLTTETEPFVLLDDAGAGGGAALYRRPVRVLHADDAAAVGTVLDRVRSATANGLHAAGFLSYEAAAAFEPALPTMAAPPTPLAWFGLFATVEAVDALAMLPDPRGAWSGAPEPLTDRASYDAQFARVRDLIVAGDLYQANLSFRSRVRFAGHPLALYARLRAAGAAGHGAVVWTGRDWLLSLSPELFFTLDTGELVARPMKGTVRRDADPAEDAALAARLVTDPKQRAENLMIVDLLRNDFARVAEPGSVRVPKLFTVETYPTLHTMTSTITARLAPGRDAVDVLGAAFPCGSITGAPKIRAITALAEVEAANGPRGIYTGSIGRIDPDGSTAFNVAIRTLHIAAGSAYATLGLGGGIVADSIAGDEWDEALAKGAFVTAKGRTFDLIETMAFDPQAGMPLLERHLERMKASATTFGYPFDRHTARNELQAATFRLRVASRVRLVLSARGSMAIETCAAPASPGGAVEVAVVPLPVLREDVRLRHKTSDRRFYDDARIAAGTFEVVFVLPDGQLTEGSFTSLFVERDGRLLTPPAGPLLPGVLRAELIGSGRAVEARLTVADLAGGFLIGNGLRGLIPARLAVAPATGAA